MRTETVKQRVTEVGAEHDLICLENEPILATDAVRVMTDNVNQDEAVLLLGHPLKIAAERKVYTLTKLIIKLIMSQLICNRRRSSTSPPPQSG